MTDNDIAYDLKITKTEGRQLNAPGTWVSGTIAGHAFQVLVFEDHADTDAFELDGSRISKLWLRRQADRQVVANFDRGWDVEPTTDIARLSTSWQRGSQNTPSDTETTKGKP